MSDAAAKGRMPKGERHYRTKMTAEDVKSILEQAASGVRKVELAERHGVSVTQIYRIVAREQWSHI